MSDDVIGWSRRRLLVVLGTVLGLAIVLIAAAGYAAWTGLTSDADQSSTRQTYPVDGNGVRGANYRDAVAAEPMLESTADDLQPAPRSTRSVPDLRIRTTDEIGRRGIPAGYGHTPAGAVGQLASISIGALDGLTLDRARDVYAAWSADSGGFARWEISRAIQDFHRGAQTVDGNGSAVLTARAVGGQVKARDGRDWVIACVQLDVTVLTTEETRFGYGHCDRMQWTGRRWVIAPGTPPAPAPSTWPGSERSVEAGWRDYVEIEKDLG